MGALPSQLFCFPTSPGHSFLTPDFSFSSVCSLRASLPGHFTPPALLSLSAPPPLQPASCVDKIQAHWWLWPYKNQPSCPFLLLRRGGWASGASQLHPLPSSKLLHCNFKVVWRKQYPGDYKSSCKEGSGFIWALRPAFLQRTVEAYVVPAS